MKIRFSKLSGAGNDFALVSGNSRIGRQKDIIAKLCSRRWGAGTDGLLLLEKRPGRTPKLSYFNADGSEAFCGNGCRCAAAWIYQAGWVKGRNFEMETRQGPVRAIIHPGHRVSIAMPNPRAVRALRVSAAGRTYAAHYVHTGVPHAIVELRNLDSFPVSTIGPILRRHPAFGRAGANVDFVSYSRGQARLRTFERGVEAETLACGTGAVAAAAVGFFLGRIKRSPASVRTAGDDILRVFFKPAGARKIEEVRLEGPAREIFQGEIEL